MDVHGCNGCKLCNIPTHWLSSVNDGLQCAQETGRGHISPYFFIHCHRRRRRRRQSLTSYNHGDRQVVYDCGIIQ